MRRMTPIEDNGTVEEPEETIVEESVESQPVNYATMTVSELKEVATDKGIKYSNKISKSKLISMLEEQA